jgi:hypothetical protein
MNERTLTASADVVVLMREALTAFYKSSGFAGADQLISRATDAEIVEAYEVMYEELK